MKNIMKKALSLMLALVMVLVLAPMTTKATIDQGEGTKENPYMMGQASDFTQNLAYDTQTFFAYSTGYSDAEQKITVEGNGGFVVGTWDPRTGEYDNGSVCDNKGSINVTPIMNKAGMGVVYYYIVNINTEGNGLYYVSVGENTSASGGGVTGTGAYQDPYDITEALDAVPGVANRQTAYYMISGLNASGKYTITVGSSNTQGNYQVSDMSGTSVADSAQVAAAWTQARIEATAYASGAVLFSITSLYGNVGDFVVDVEEVTQSGGGAQVGSEENKAELVFDEITEVVPFGAYGKVYHMTWTADAEGYLSIEFPNNLNLSGWMCNISEEDFAFDAVGSESAYENDEDPETTYANPVTVGVKEGEIINIFVAATDYVAGTISYKASFEAGTVERVEETPDFREETMNEEEDYIQAYDVITEGETEAPVSLIFSHTLYDFCPTEAGIYTITVSGGVVGKWGDSMNILTNPNATTSTVEVTINSVGQSAIIGLTGLFEETVIITATKTGNVEEEVVAETNDYENTVTPSNQTLAGDFEDYQYVNIDDTTVDKAVLGADGFYHLNAADGPVLWVVLNDTWLSLMGAATANDGAGMLIEAIIEDGKVVEKINYSAALMAYAGCAATAEDGTKLYPMTADLKAMLEKAGTSLGWYDAKYGIVGSEVDTKDNWMFCTMYVEDVLEGADSNWTQDSKEGVTIRFNIPFAEFKELKIDGKVVDPKYYTAKEGSTIITLSADYLNTLEVGKHTVTAVTTNNETVETSISIVASEINNTGDATGLYIAILLLGCVALVAGFAAKKRFA